jgi:hypothetical protein
VTHSACTPADPGYVSVIDGHLTQWRCLVGITCAVDFTPDGKGTLGGCGDTPIEQLFEKDKMEKNSKVAKMPSDAELVSLAKAWLEMV